MCDICGREIIAVITACYLHDLHGSGHYGICVARPCASHHTHARYSRFHAHTTKYMRPEPYTSSKLRATDHAHSSHDAVCMPLPGASAPAAAPPTIACAATTCQVRHLHRTNASSHHAALARRAPRLASRPRNQCTCWQPADCRPVLRQQLCPSPPSPSPSPVFRCRYGTACTRRRCAAPAPPLRRSRVVTAPLLRRRRAAPALPLCLPTDKGALGLRVWVSSCRETARQRQKAETQGAARRNAERTCTQRDRPGRERVDISLLPVHVEEASSHVEPAWPQGAAGSC